MGAIHEGHLDLVRAAKACSGKVITSIFVNPTQFAAHEDLSTYPRNEASDAAALESAGCDLIYAPDAIIMYPHGFSTAVSVSGVTSDLEGAFRPHFFGGVATVVAKLFIQIGPDVAMFGEKDWQQLQVVTTMVRDLDLPLTIRPVETRREADGLALSSRNTYLTPEQRLIAPALNVALNTIMADIRAGISSHQAEKNAIYQLLGAGFASIDYLSARHATRLTSWKLGDPLRVLGAAFLGKTRLIDNVGD